MVTLLAAAALVKIATGLPVAFRYVRRAGNDYLVRRGAREVAKERELWRRARWELDAAKELRRRLLGDAELWTRMREQLPGLFDKHPEYLPVLHRLEEGTQAKIAQLDDTVRRVYGGWEQRCLPRA